MKYLQQYIPNLIFDFYTKIQHLICFFPSGRSSFFYRACPSIPHFRSGPELHEGSVYRSNNYFTWVHLLAVLPPFKQFAPSVNLWLSRSIQKGMTFKKGGLLNHLFKTWLFNCGMNFCLQSKHQASIKLLWCYSSSGPLEPEPFWFIRFWNVKRYTVAWHDVWWVNERLVCIFIF